MKQVDLRNSFCLFNQNFFFGKSRACQITKESAALNRGDYVGNSFILDVANSECNEYFFNSGYEIVRFTTEDKNIDFVSNIGNNMVVHAIAVRRKHRCFLSDHYEFIKNEKTEERILLSSSNESVEPYDYHM